MERAEEIEVIIKHIKEQMRKALSPDARLTDNERTDIILDLSDSLRNYVIEYNFLNAA